MHEKLMDIQNEFWRTYMALLRSDSERSYKTGVDAIIRKYRDGDMRCFCEGLKSSWEVVIYGDKDLKESHADVSDIQKTVWDAYKDFASTRDMRKWNGDMLVLAAKYRDAKDGNMLKFCKYLAITWMPVVTRIREGGA